MTMTNPSNVLWEEPIWFAKASCWIDNQLYRQGIKRIGSIEQFRVRHWSTVLQISTSIGDIYFKAVIPELAYEAALTETLSYYYPHCMPQILATSSLDGWLLMGDGGMKLREKIKTEDDIQHWQEILPIYAELQKNSAKHLDELLSLGVCDRRLAVLPILYQELLTNTEALATNYPAGLSSFECQRLQDTVDVFTSLCEQLATFGVPETVDHGDLHDGNIFIHDGRYIFFDWGDSSISHPFFSIGDTYASLNRRFGLGKSSFWFKRIKDCYLESSVEYETREKLEVAFELAQKLSPIPDIFRWLPVLSNMDEATRNNYIDAIPNLLREFLSTIEV
ncbi:MAG: phosphotransferase [Heteroscytonema crispum UTEX LB 1556]